jgi:hypothetical protein
VFFFPPSTEVTENGDTCLFGQPQKCRKCNGSDLMRHRWRHNVSTCFLGQFHTRFLIRFRVFSLGLLLVQARIGLGLVECCLLPFFVCWPWECKNYAYSGCLPRFSVTLPTNGNLACYTISSKIRFWNPSSFRLLLYTSLHLQFWLQFALAWDRFPKEQVF